MGRMARLLRLPLVELRLLSEAALTLAGVRLLLVFLPFSSAMRLLRLRPDAGRVGGACADPAMARAVAIAIWRAGRAMPVHAFCLHRATAAALMLRRRGLTAEVRFGVRKRGGAVEAHAWTYSGEVPVCDAECVDDFAPIAVFRT